MTLNQLLILLNAVGIPLNVWLALLVLTDSAWLAAFHSAMVVCGASSVSSLLDARRSSNVS